jgi:aspartate 1-decarboxylase
MRRIMLKSKIHNAMITQTELKYSGSITIDSSLLEKADIVENERVQVVNVNNGERFETYVIKGEIGKGDICLNGAAARLVHKGDKVIIMSYCMVSEEEAKEMKPTVVHVDFDNKIVD